MPRHGWQALWLPPDRPSLPSTHSPLQLGQLPQQVTFRRPAADAQTWLAGDRLAPNRPSLPFTHSPLWPG